MIYLLAALAGVVGAVAGYVLTALATFAVAGLFGVSDFEGQRGMLAAFGAGPLGGLVGLVLGVLATLRLGHGRASLGRLLARAGATVAAVLAVAGAAVAYRLLTLDSSSSVAPPRLEFELRVPATMPTPDPPGLRVEVHTAENVAAGTLEPPWSPTDDGHRAITGAVPLVVRTTSRLLVVTMPGEPTRLYRLPLARDPRPTATVGAWRHADQVDRPEDAGPSAAPPDDPVELRYRVRPPQ